MNALNVGSAEVTRSQPPLVADMGQGYFLWIEKGHGFTLSTATGQWHPLADGEGIGGTVLKEHQVVALVAAYGSPFKPKPECDGICLYGADVGVPEHSGVAYAHPGCPKHDPLPEGECDGGNCGYPCSVCSAAFGSPCDYDDEDRFARCPGSKRECICAKKAGGK